jgi:hypothetical protein
MQTLFLVYVGGGILLALLAVPLMAGKVKPNPFYGFRVPATLENPELWYATNKFFARRQVAVALIVISAAVGLSFLPNISTDTYALSILTVFIITFAVAIFQSWRYLKSLQ